MLEFLLPGVAEIGDGEKSNNGNGSVGLKECEGLKERVRGLRDLVEVKVDVEGEGGGDEGEGESGGKKEGENSSWVCPITSKQLGPGVKSVYIVPCGHVFCEEAIRQIKGDRCLQCNEPYTEENIIPILPTSEQDKQRLVTRARNLAEQGLTHSLKKAPGLKKRKKHAANGDANTNTNTADVDSIPATTTDSSSKPKQQQQQNGSTGIKHATTAMITARVLEEENEKKKRRKMGKVNENLDSLFTKRSGDGLIRDTNADFMSRAA